MNHTVYRAPEGETTEWEDLHRKFGNLPKLEEKKDDYYAESDEEPDREARMAALSDSDVEDLEDDGFEDRKFLEEWKQRRVEQLRQAAQAAKFGTVRYITRSEFVTEVTNASKEGPVVCILYMEGQDHSQLLLAAASAAAAKRPDIKFVKIVAQNCVEGYPERNTPTVFVYSDGAVAKQVVTLRELAGTAVNADVLEWMLSEAGVIQTELEEDPRPGAVAQARARRDEGTASGAASSSAGWVRSSRVSDDEDDM